MSKIKSFVTSISVTVMSVVGFVMPVLGQRQELNNPVAGVVTAVNKFAIVAPYLVLAGIVAIASAVYIKRRKK